MGSAAIFHLGSYELNTIHDETEDVVVRMASPMTQVNTPFIPSPQWLSESPANPQLQTPSSGRRSTRRPIFDARNDLMSPIPPAPANLNDPIFVGGLSVDPGIPFLATAGPSERDDASDRGSIDESQRPRRGNSFIGGFVKGFKRAVTLPRPPKKEWTLDQQEFYGLPPVIRDSGYASSPNQSAAGPAFPIPHISYYPDDDEDTRTVSSRSAPSETLIGHHDRNVYSKPYERYQEHPKHSQRPYRQEDEETIIGSDSQSSAATSASYITANPEVGSDYAKMDVPTPPMSDVSLNSYTRRFKKLVKTVADLPWVATERVTADYYPEKNRRCDEDAHPAIIWHNPNTGVYENSHDYSDLGSSNDSSSNSSMLQAPRRHTSHADIDLDAEFEGTSRIPQIPLAPGTPYGSWVATPTSQLRHYPTETPQSSQFFAPPTPWDDRPRTPTQMPQAPYVEYVPSAGTQRSTRSRRSTHPRAQPIYDSQYYAEPSSYEPRAQADAYSVADGWEEYPLYPNGYVQPEYTEHYYGERYGSGIHAERPPR